MPHRLRLVSVLAAIAGAVLFAWSIRRAGTNAVLDGITRVGAGFAIVWLLGGVRSIVRTIAWRFCLSDDHQLTLPATFAAYLAGDAIGNVTPFGFLISEPSKIVLVRNLVAAKASISALTIENLFYSATVAMMLVAGTGALLLSFDVPTMVRIGSLATLGGAVLMAVAAARVMVRQSPVLSAGVERLIQRGVAPAFLRARLPHVLQIEERVFGFVDRHPEKVLPLVVLEVGYHATAIAEIWFALGLIIGTWPSLLTAFVLEYVNRTITIAFQFVPMWIGVDEAGTSLVTGVLRLGPAAGVSLALVRKARVIVWTGIGIALLLRRGLSLEDIDADRVPNHLIANQGMTTPQAVNKSASDQRVRAYPRNRQRGAA